jgi:hypothetical protein
MTGAVAKKLGIKEGARAIMIDAPDGVLETIDPPRLDLAERLTGEFDYIHLFATSRDAFDKRFPALKRHLKAGGMLWVSWPKNGQLGTDLRLPVVIELGYNHGLVESKTISIDATWSAIRFTHPKPGKRYDNSYGTLPERDEEG